MDAGAGRGAAGAGFDLPFASGSGGHGVPVAPGRAEQPDGALDTGVVFPQNKPACPATVDQGSLTYLAVRKTETGGEARFEFGAHAFGPRARELAESMNAAIATWGHVHRNGSGPRIGFHPNATDPQSLPEGRVLPKRHGSVVTSWPDEGQAASHDLGHEE